MSARKKSARKRGRPRLANAKRRATTREGRRTGQDPVDEGAPRLVQRKRRVAAGRTDLPLDGAAVLFEQVDDPLAGLGVDEELSLLAPACASARGKGAVPGGLEQ